MAAKRKQRKAETPKHHRYMFFLSLFFAISSIGLTIYDYSQGQSIFDHHVRGGVLAAHATPTPTKMPTTP